MPVARIEETRRDAAVIVGMRLTDKIVNAHFHCYTELGANAIRSTDQHGVLVARCLEVENAAKASDLCVRAGAAGCTDEGFDGFNKGVSGVDGHASLRVRQAFGPSLCRQRS